MPSFLNVRLMQSIGPLNCDEVCRRTLTVSNGCSTSLPHIPAIYDDENGGDKLCTEPKSISLNPEEIFSIKFLEITRKGRSFNFKESLSRFIDFSTSFVQRLPLEMVPCVS